MPKNRKVIIVFNDIPYMFFRADQLWYSIGGDDVPFAPVDQETAKQLKQIALDLGYDEDCFLPPPPPPAHLIEGRKKKNEDKPEKVKKPGRPKKDPSEKAPRKSGKATLSIKLF